MTALHSAVAAAAAGPLLEAEMVPLNNKGSLRIYYEWLYSALNCDPGNSSRFIWVLNKIDENRISLSPKEPYRNMKLYASVRDDWSWYVQVQAPRSADWIRAVGRNEILNLESQSGLLIISLKGWNGQYVAVDADISTHQDAFGNMHSGYRLRSVGTGDLKARSWFLGVSQILQAGLQLPLHHELTQEDIRRELRAYGLAAEDEDVSRLHAHFVNKT
jgi:hypothetical protein